MDVLLPTFLLVLLNLCGTGSGSYVGPRGGYAVYPVSQLEQETNNNNNNNQQSTTSPPSVTTSTTTTTTTVDPFVVRTGGNGQFGGRRPVRPQPSGVASSTNRIQRPSSQQGSTYNTQNQFGSQEEESDYSSWETDRGFYFPGPDSSQWPSQPYPVYNYMRRLPPTV